MSSDPVALNTNVPGDEILVNWYAGPARTSDGRPIPSRTRRRLQVSTQLGYLTLSTEQADALRDWMTDNIEGNPEARIVTEPDVVPVEAKIDDDYPQVLVVTHSNGERLKYLMRDSMMFPGAVYRVCHRETDQVVVFFLPAGLGMMPFVLEVEGPKAVRS